MFLIITNDLCFRAKIRKIIKIMERISIFINYRILHRHVYYCILVKHIR